MTCERGAIKVLEGLFCCKVFMFVLGGYGYG
jgi:hypothetical protein